jgi:tRNA A37 threonylcarbamoyladenosine modification protein TsaB
MVLEWWNDFARWFVSETGQRVISGVVIPFVAILAAGLLAGLITRSSMKRFVAHQDRQSKAAAVAALIAAGRKAATWSLLTAQEKEYVEHMVAETEIRVRLLPVSGASLAAEWAGHHIASMKKNSAAYSSQAEQDALTLRDGLVEWQAKPNRAKKLFAQDLSTWKYDDSGDSDLEAKQREWSAQQQTEATSVL